MIFRRTRWVVLIALALLVATGATLQSSSRAVAQTSPYKIYIPLAIKEWVQLLERTPNDPYYANAAQWALKPGAAGTTADLRAAEAWGLTTGDSSIVVAIVDTGVDSDHPDLVGKLLPGWNVTTEDANSDDDMGHGTHVAGLVAASTDNGLGMAGVAWGAKLLPIRIFDAAGSANTLTVRDGIYAAIERGARVINLSVGTTAVSQAINEALDEAYLRGVFVVAAAGNCGDQAYSYNGCTRLNQPFYPAAAAHSLAVAATNRTDEHASFSTEGAYVDVAAPGADILSTWPNHLQTPAYQWMSGTSMAAPIVSGLAALLSSRYPTYGPDQLAAAIVGNAVDLGIPRWDEGFGCGRIDLYRALEGGADGACLGWPGYAAQVQPEVAATAASEAQIRPGSVLVKYKDPVAAAARGQGKARHAGRGLYELPVTPGAERSAVAALRADPAVAYAEPIYLVQALD
ncbi:MAG: S8 family serine peptidase [Chloroflexota bacterium]